jgi:shikimate kinase
MKALTDETNVVLIGMPGVGKSTVGVLLAKSMAREFVDTDVIIQAREGRRLQDIINAEGTDLFCAREERHVLSLRCKGHVIATGGSVVYSEGAMCHLKASGVVVHLELPFEALERRLRNLDSRGVVMEPRETLRDVYAKRLPLYRRYADHTIECAGLNHEEVVATIVRSIVGTR